MNRFRRRASGLALTALLFLGAGPALAAPALPPSSVDGPPPAEVTLLGWLNMETRMADAIVLGRVEASAYPHPQTLDVRVPLRVEAVLNGGYPKGPSVVRIPPDVRDGRAFAPEPMLKGQWMLAFLRRGGGRWEVYRGARVVETPYQGLRFYARPEIRLLETDPAMPWATLLGELQRVVETRRKVINGHLPSLRAAAPGEGEDRARLDIEYQVKEALGLPLP